MRIDAWPNRGPTERERLGGRNERESCRAGHSAELRTDRGLYQALGSAGNPAPRPGGRGRDNRAAVHRSHRSRAIGGVLMPHFYKRPANHWKTPPRFERRQTDQEEESRPLRKRGTPRSLKDIIKAEPRRRAPWK